MIDHGDRERHQQQIMPKRKLNNRIKKTRTEKIGLSCPACWTTTLTATCSKTPTAATVEHIVPLFQGGTNSVDKNIEIICLSCNQARNSLLQHYQNRNVTVPIEYWQLSLIRSYSGVINSYYREFHEFFLKVRYSQ